MRDLDPIMSFGPTLSYFLNLMFNCKKKNNNIKREKEIDESMVEIKA